MGDEYNNDKNKLMDYIEIELKYFNQRMARCELIYYDTNDKFTEWKKEELFHFANELKVKYFYINIANLDISKPFK